MQAKSSPALTWLLLLTISQVSSYLILQFKDINGNLTSNLIKAMKNNEINNEDDLKNVTYQVLTKHFPGKDGFRKMQNVKDFMHKKLVKRVVPHGYSTKDYEYDEKFKTLFKPLIRIHKRKNDAESSDEDTFDLIYLIDDKRFEDAPLNKDDDLLKPFTVNRMKLRYLSNDENNPEYFINKNINNFDADYDSQQSKKHKQSKYKLVDNTNDKKFKKIPNNLSPFYKNKNNLMPIFETQKGQLVGSDKLQTMSKLNQFLGKVAEIKMDKNKPDNSRSKTENLNRFVTVGHLSTKQFKPGQNHNLMNDIEESNGRSYMLQGIHNINTDDNKISIYDLLKHLAAIKTEVPPQPWFGPVGVINSKQLTKTNGYENIDPKSRQGKLRYKPKIILNQLTQQETDTSDENQETSDLELDKNVRGYFGSIGHVISKHLKLDDLDRNPNTALPLYIIKPIYRQGNKEYEGTKSNRHVPKEEGNKKERKGPFKKKMVYPMKELRTHVTSGEEEETALKQKEQFDYHDDTTTEIVPSHQKPHYPFWNYWTYDNQILEDDCKGKLIQSGRFCIGAWA